MDADRRVTWTYDRAAFDILAANKDANGDVVFLTNSGAVVRIDHNRKEKKTITIPQYPMGNLEVLPNGNILVTQRQGIGEFDANGNQQSNIPVNRPSGLQRLSNGNTLVTVSGNPGNPSVLELDRAGRTVWEYKPADGVIPYRARRR
jgi:hypothetical protein